ncbi:amidohydrolase family protein [Microbulbifer guangxiensis]|uniref:amidohydrolase family protein n=1 Tax=Microbulbifer guangxiensis TaxID=2904249 RepID=UPI001F4720DD|nr:amidohydrolase family protein [Microbulbifer guangxiensis]
MWAKGAEVMRWAWVLCILLLAAGCGKDAGQGEAGARIDRAGSQSPGVAGPELADLVLTNASIYSAQGQLLRGQTIAVRDGRIIYLGDADSGSRLIGGPTRVENLEGKLVLPGATDPRMHRYAVDALVNLYGASGIADYQRTIAEFIEAHPGQQLVVGAGWRESDFAGQPPHKGQLDQVSDLIPILMFSADHQTLWTNSEAVAAAGINIDTSQPTNGVIERDDNGLVIGVFREPAAMALVEVIIPRVESSQDQHGPGVAELLEDELKVGKTADFTIVADNPDGVGSETLYELEVLRSYHHGQVIYDASASGSLPD